MDPSKLEVELKKYKRNEDTTMSPLVRSRLDETYASLPETSSERKGRVSRPRMRKTASVAVATVMLGVAVFTSGFISPVMAQSIKKIPVVGSLFSSIEADLGLRAAGEKGLTSSVNKSISYQDVKLNVTETVFDGTRAVFLLDVTAPNLKEGMFDTGEKEVKLSNAIDSVVFKVNGQVKDGVNYYSAGGAHPNVLIFEEILGADEPNASATNSDTFHAEVLVKLTGIDHEFTLDVPFQKTTKDIMNLNPNAIQKSGNLSVTIAEVNVTPVTTRLLTTITLDDQTSDQLTHTRVAVFDDQGRQLPALNGEGTLEDKKITFDGRYATTGKTKYLIIKPFVYQDDFSEKVRDDQYIKGLELKMELPAQNE
ncbi:DUF4179 domain-containing protein [Brevibacillus choshinensis]|uniref:DUF4179 domain-containing protein n=1 Tax=Brevibacillus choshinensis TaxID=54911 RepID=UPI002E1E688E|nr:DUF4179 domain-containing protein [Brevibacillus choshinensis]